MILEVNSVTKTFGHSTILDDVSFSVTPGEKVALIGINGCGKTSLFKIITGEDKEFSGSVNYPKSAVMGVLTQDQPRLPDTSLFDYCKFPFKKLLELEKSIKEKEKELSQNPDNKKLVKSYGELLHTFEENDGYHIDRKIETVLFGLGFSALDFKRELTTFSGGETRRANLAVVLLSKPNILLLDEPTNHLDIESIKWLEDFIVSYSSSVFMICHDKYFIDRTCTRILELEKAGIHSFKSPYAKYQEEKLKIYEVNAVQYDRQQTEIKKQKDFIQKNLAGQKTKQAKSRRKMLEKMETIEKPLSLNYSYNLSFEDAPRLARAAIEIEDLAIKYDGLLLFSDLNFKVGRGERIAIIGNNGTGKSTLIKVIMDIIKPHDGRVRISENTSIGYFSQDDDNIDSTMSVFDAVHEIKPLWNQTEIRSFLGKYYFCEDIVFNQISTLSGGEKSRLAMILFLLKPYNLFILDEPTNHLDIFSRQALAESLKDFPGAVLFVSHDRAFIDRIATHIFILSGKKLTKCIGNYTSNKERIDMPLARLSSTLSASDKSTQDNKKADMTSKPSKSSKTKKVNPYKLSAVEYEIMKLEDLIDDLEKQMQSPDLYSDYVKMQEVVSKMEESKALLKEKYQIWNELIDN